MFCLIYHIMQCMHAACSTGTHGAGFCTVHVLFLVLVMVMAMVVEGGGAHDMML
jgi:hypothetical protein